MLIDPQFQIKGILSLIQHHLQVGLTERIFEIHIDEFKPYPDHRSIMDMFSGKGVIELKHEPEERIVLEIEHPEPYEQETEWYKGQLSYALRVTDKFDEYCAEVLGKSHKNSIALEASDINLMSSNYIAKTGVLALTPYLNLHITEQGLSSGKNRINTRQCKFMKQLFRNNDTLQHGITVYQLEVIKEGEKLKNNSVKNYKNIQTAINSKFYSVTGLKKLIIFKDSRFKVNPSYLLKT